MSITLGQYSGALKIHGVDAIKGIEIDRFERVRNGQEPLVYVGNFAATYKMMEKGHKGKSKHIGVRVWHSNVEQSDIERYRLLNRILPKLTQDAPTNVKFCGVKLLEPDNEEALYMLMKVNLNKSNF